MRPVTMMKCISILKDYTASSGEGGGGELKSRERLMMRELKTSGEVAFR